MKVVVNRTFDLYFGLSDAAIYRYAELAGIQLYKESEWPNAFYNLKRTDSYLVQVVEELGDDANYELVYGTGMKMRSNLKIIEIPDGIEFEIRRTLGTGIQYGTYEQIQELGRVW